MSKKVAGMRGLAGELDVAKSHRVLPGQLASFVPSLLPWSTDARHERFLWNCIRDVPFGSRCGLFSRPEQAFILTSCPGKTVHPDAGTSGCGVRALHLGSAARAADGELAPSVVPAAMIKSVAVATVVEAVVTEEDAVAMQPAARYPDAAGVVTGTQ